MSITLKEVDHMNSDLHQLIYKLDCYFKVRYPEDGIFGLDFNDPKVKEVNFAVAYFNDTPAGCGGIRPLDRQSAELKRFFVDSEYRNKGIASHILEHLEFMAKSKGFTSIKLETGPEQPESISFYRKHGYMDIKLFGEYTDSKYSICMEKKL